MKNVVLLSGGVDSTVLLADRVAAGNECVTVTFDYSQTHRREINAARTVADHYGVENILLPLRDIFASSALLGVGDIPDGHAENPDATTVPGRNLVMLSIASAIADARGASAVFFGANADDYAGYIDCRPVFLDALSAAVARGTTRSVGIYTPFLSWTKAEIVDVGRMLNAPLHLTWSCYRGGEQPCGSCGACESLREAM